MRVNPLFLLLLCIYCALGLARQVLCIFGAVLVHELAHTVVARLMGTNITEVELLPFGGQAKTEDFLAIHPEREIYIALAGPLTSLALAGGVFLVKANLGEWDLLFFMRINLVLGLFNLIPALPLDGGRVLRAVLANRVGFRRATRAAALLGEVVALALVAYGGYVAYHFREGANFIFVGILLFWAARKEARFLAYAFMRYLVHKKGELSKKGVLPVYQVVSTPQTLITDILNSTSPSSYMMVMVVDERERLCGIVTEAQLIEALFEGGPLVTLEDIRPD